MIEIRLSSPLLLIAIGVGYLLANLGIIPITPWGALTMYWPALIIWFGLIGLVKRSYKILKRKYVDPVEYVINLLVVLLGFYLLAPRVGWETVPISWNLVWPALLVIYGVYKLFEKNIHRPQFRNVDNNGYKASFVGEIHKGGSSWVLDDMHLRHGVGEVHLDLTHAIIPDREVTIDISGLVGEVTLYLPSELPLKADCSTSIGDVIILDQQANGIGRSLTFQTPDYEEATRKLNLYVRWKIGEIKVRRIG